MGVTGGFVDRNMALKQKIKKILQFSIFLLVIRKDGNKKMEIIILILKYPIYYKSEHLHYDAIVPKNDHLNT